MKMHYLTSAKVREIMPTACLEADERGDLVLGGIQIPTPSIDAWPSDYDMEREAQAKFGAAKLGDCRDDDGDTTATWLVLRA